MFTVRTILSLGAFAALAGSVLADDFTDLNVSGRVTFTQPNQFVLMSEVNNTWAAKNAVTKDYDWFLCPRYTDNVTYLNYGDAGFNVRNNASASTLFMTAGNKVGIGTTAPSEKLHVVGNIKATGTIIANSVQIKDWSIEVPDYVFDKGYRLAPLSETEKYVAANKHLPGIPSAGQMKAEGMDLAAMNLRLLQKVEELTLHMIEQEKKIKQLEARVR
jgi:hypothetical protein